MRLPHSPTSITKVTAHGRTGARRIDTLCTKLQKLKFAVTELWPCDTEGGMMLDGCAYRVSFAHPGNTITVEFQPISARYRRWAQQFFSLAEMLQKKSDNSKLGQYLEVWKPYLD